MKVIVFSGVPTAGKTSLAKLMAKLTNGHYVSCSGLHKKLESIIDIIPENNYLIKCLSYSIRALEERSTKNGYLFLDEQFPERVNLSQFRKDLQRLLFPPNFFSFYFHITISFEIYRIRKEKRDKCYIDNNEKDKLKFQSLIIKANRMIEGIDNVVHIDGSLPLFKNSEYIMKFLN